MNKDKLKLLLIGGTLALLVVPALSQSIDRTQNPNSANAGIAKSLPQEIGAGRGDVTDARFFGLHHRP